MKILVGYNGGEVGATALSLARDYAKTYNAFVYVLTSLEGGSSEKASDIRKAEEGLVFAKKMLELGKMPEELDLTDTESFQVIHCEFVHLGQFHKFTMSHVLSLT